MPDVVCIYIVYFNVGMSMVLDCSVTAIVRENLVIMMILIMVHTKVMSVSDL